MKKITLTATALFFLGDNPAFANELAKELETGVKQQKRNYYVRSKSYSSNPESDPPRYVNQLDKTGIKEFEKIDWIDLGLNHRVRFENRYNDFRREIDTSDHQSLHRTQAYFGVKNILDPLRFAIELQDSRVVGGKFARNTTDVNKLDIFQAYGELYFKDPVLIDRPISLRAGRMAFEVIDRKLLARDEWGNTGTNFQGFRTIIGTQNNDWQLDSFALQPVIESMNANDYPNQNQWIYATILNWRKWSDKFTIQPFYFMMDQEKSQVLSRRKINSPGIRAFGDIGESNFDYDLIGVYQFGEVDSQKHLATAYSAEIGQKYNYKSKPRLSLSYFYASGDKNPDDNKNQRFERFYGFNRPWSNSNTIEWENIKAAKARFEIQPHNKIRMEGSYSQYWLASATDSWRRGNDLRDKNGASGDKIGWDFDFRSHYQINEYLNATLGYAHFEPGKFAKNAGRGGVSDFIYLELTASLFGWRAN